MSVILCIKLRVAFCGLGGGVPDFMTMARGRLWMCHFTVRAFPSSECFAMGSAGHERPGVAISSRARFLNSKIHCV